jgi:hypothetical protein
LDLRLPSALKGPLGRIALGIAAGITMLAGAFFPSQKEYGLLAIFIVLVTFGLLGRRFIASQMKTG